MPTRVKAWRLIIITLISTVFVVIYITYHMLYNIQIIHKEDSTIPRKGNILLELRFLPYSSDVIKIRQCLVNLTLEWGERVEKNITCYNNVEVFSKVDIEFHWKINDSCFKLLNYIILSACFDRRYCLGIGFSKVSGINKTVIFSSFPTSYTLTPGTYDIKFLLDAASTTNRKGKCTITIFIERK